MRGVTPTSCVAVAAFLLAVGHNECQATDKNVKIGEHISNLTFKDIHYLPRSLDDFPKARVFVLAFTNTSCPVVQRYLPVLKALEKDYRNKGAQFLAINEGADDSIVAMASQAVKYEMEFPFVKDFDGECAGLLGVGRTGEVVVLDEQRHIRYRGRIDDQYRLGGTRAAPTRRDLALALDAVLAGNEVAVSETTVDGCPITRAELAPVQGHVTFTGDISPILQKHCAECHHPGTTAPFSLITYENAKAQAEAIAEVVSDGRMPPWYASDDYGHLLNKRSLSNAEKAKLIHWARNGMEVGDTSALPHDPPPPKSEDRWLIGKPDLVLSAPQHDIPEKGLVDYKYIVLKQLFLSDTWMEKIQILPDNPRVVHHCNMAYFLPLEKKTEAHFITGTVPGGSPMVLGQTVGFLIPRGAMLVLQIHYVTTGKPEKCQISVGFKYSSGVVQKRLYHHLMVDNKFAIPPGAPAYPVSASQTLERDGIGLGLFVHMHVRGRDMTFRATYPDGKTETLLMVPNYSFDWQMPYRWVDSGIWLPKGTRLEALAHYDNSTFNPYNPDPNATVREGLQTQDEMLNGFVFYIDANEQLNLNVDGKTGHARPR